MKIAIVIALTAALLAAGYFTIGSVTYDTAIVQLEPVVSESGQSDEALQAIEDYLSLRSELGLTNQKISALQDIILAASDGLITADKQDYERFDREAKALRTILSMELDDQSDRTEP